jgi:Tfp pilus assembly protein PilO
MKLITPFIVIAICIGMYFFYISPTAMEVKALSLKKAEYNTVLEKSRELMIKRDEVLGNYNAISDTNIARLEKVIPETFDTVLFANDLNGMASQYGMTVKDLKVNEPKTEVRDTIINSSKNKTFKTTAVGFKVSGSYAQFTKFLESLESSLRIVDVVGLHIQSGANTKGSESPLDYTLEVNTYSLR